MGADKYAADTYQKAVVNLENARAFLHSKNENRKRSETAAREAAQMAEDARIITLKKIDDEQLAAERAAAANAKRKRVRLPMRKVPVACKPRLIVPWQSKRREMRR